LAPASYGGPHIADFGGFVFHWCETGRWLTVLVFLVAPRWPPLAISFGVILVLVDFVLESLALAMDRRGQAWFLPWSMLPMVSDVTDVGFLVRFE